MVVSSERLQVTQTNRIILTQWLVCSGGSVGAGRSVVLVPKHNDLLTIALRSRRTAVWHVRDSRVIKVIAGEAKLYS